MWIIQVAVGAFWLYIGTALLFREAAMWDTVENIDWFKKNYGNSYTKKWERFCRYVGLVCLATACLLFLTLPYGIGVLGVMVLGLTLPIAYS